jgi:urease accessory protein
MRRAALIPLLLASFAAWGHPADAAGFVHPFTGLDHLLAMLAVGIWAAQLGGRWTWAVPLAFVGSMALGGALGFGGVRLPLVEPTIAASVLVLGLLVVLRVQLRMSGLALAGVFALFHGIAHAAEIPGEASRIVYSAGFVCATALLHAAGVGLGMLPRARLAGVPVALAGLWLLASSAV